MGELVLGTASVLTTLYGFGPNGPFLCTLIQYSYHDCIQCVVFKLRNYTE